MINTHDNNFRVYDPEHFVYDFEEGTILRSKLAEHAKKLFGIRTTEAHTSIMKMDERTYHIARITLYTSHSFIQWYEACERLATLSWIIPKYVVTALTNGNIVQSSNKTFLQDLCSYRTIINTVK